MADAFPPPDTLPRPSSPSLDQHGDTGWLMYQVLLAMLPGIAALVWFFGWGVVVNLAVAAASAVVAEACALRLRRRRLMPYLSDCSALVTAALLAVAVPPYCPWWVVASGVVSAIWLGKHVYGGLGYNPFNPAMVGYVILLISFPVPMTQWAPPSGAIEGHQALGLTSALLGNLGLATLDAATMATPLEVVREAANQGLAQSELLAERPEYFGRVGGLGWEWVNLGFLLGGLYLMLWRRIFSWHAPLGFLGALALAAAIFDAGDTSASHGSAAMHLFSGATMLGAFFIITDPVSGATSKRGRLIYGTGAGALLFIFRAWSNYPDGVAFAVLLMNFAAPLIDHWTRPRSYGH